VPQNRRAYEQAMQILRRRGDHEGAAEYAQMYLDRVGSDRGFEKRLQVLKRLIRQKETGAKMCPGCGAENPPGTGTCIYCGRVMTLPSDLVAGCRTDIGMQASLMTAVTLLVAAIAVTIFSANQLIAGVLFIGAFSTFFAYLYVRYD
jgi:ribosomal protein L40E